MEVYKFVEPKEVKIPVLISVPHSGTAFPNDIEAHFLPEQLKSLEDTDWYVDQLYDFARSFGCSMIIANYHRWVIDLNRHPSSKPLYDDGRNITELCPTSTFNNEPLYYDQHMPDANEIERRIKTYYEPYYHKIQETLDFFIKTFGIALLWDAHSIRQYVPGIRKEVFPDLILGDNEGKSADDQLIQLVLQELDSGHYKLAHNNPFKGGNITRHFGHPSKNQHALQLEMTKINYMDNEEEHYDTERADHVRQVLKKVFSALKGKLPNERI